MAFTPSSSLEANFLNLSPRESIFPAISQIPLRREYTADDAKNSLK